MDEDDHGIFLVGLHLPRWKKPALNVEAIVSPLKILGFAPRGSLSGIATGQLAPFTDRSSPDFWWRFKAAAFCGREFSIPGNGKVREITEGMKSLCAFPDCAHRIIGECQFRDRASAADYLGEKDAIRRQPKQRTHRAFAISRTVPHVIPIRGDSKEVATLKSFVAHQP